MPVKNQNVIHQYLLVQNSQLSSLAFSWHCSRKVYVLKSWIRNIPEYVSSLLVWYAFYCLKISCKNDDCNLTEKEHARKQAVIFTHDLFTNEHRSEIEFNNSHSQCARIHIIQSIKRGQTYPFTKARRKDGSKTQKTEPEDKYEPAGDVQQGFYTAACSVKWKAMHRGMPGT